MSIKKVSRNTVLELLKSHDFSFALIDVRERTEYESKQILFATNIPKRLLEFRVSKLVPVKNTKIVLYCNDESRSALSADTLEKLGYTSVYVLEGGLNQWEKQDNYLINGVNVPSKAFGERVSRNVPYLEPQTVNNRLTSDESNFIIIDVRPVEEVKNTGSIPGAINIPGVELYHEIYNYIESDKKDIILTCAGRTRSIIASQTLREMGFKNVYNLKNGTMGWVLANLELNFNTPQPNISKSNSSRLNTFISQLIQENSIQLISLKDYLDLRNDSDYHTLYEFDVRTTLEYVEGHIPGTYNLPGGQAIQEADDHIGVRKGNIVFISNDRHRSVITAYWYKKMGFENVFVLDGGVEQWKNSGFSIEEGETQASPLGYNTANKNINLINAPNLKGKLVSMPKLTIIDVDTSQSYQSGHIPNSLWLSRSWLEFYIHEVAKESDTIVLTCHNGYGSTLCAATLLELGFKDIYVLEGGKKAWSKAGYSFEYGSKGFIKEPDDIYLDDPERGKKHMHDYLVWEIDLETQLSHIQQIYQNI
ncbi:rhodanese-like domain-containing protein [Psychrobacillus sp. NPDC096623]|uniref:rhodanese-like domain-containing protein n=1 Tax=Psychrobacillus sp. NPDC096623 TaxID=3364492 RepID=UPI0038050A1A